MFLLSVSKCQSFQLVDFVQIASSPPSGAAGPISVGSVSAPCLCFCRVIGLFFYEAAVNGGYKRAGQQNQCDQLFQSLMGGLTSMVLGGEQILSSGSSPVAH